MKLLYLPFKMRQSLLWLGASILLLLIYWPGLHGPLIFDDMPNIVENKKIHIDNLSVINLADAMFSTRTGPLYRPISMASFALNIYFFGESLIAFKAINLIIHGLAGAALYFFVYQLISSYRILQIGGVWGQHANTIIPGIVAALWLVHPLNLTSVLYVVQRMTSLAGLFTFLGLGLYCSVRLRMISGTGRWWPRAFGAVTCLVLGVLCKETAALLPFLCLILELMVYRFKTVKKQDYRWIQLFAISGLVALISIIVVLLLNLEWLMASYEYREFSLYERLLTQPRVLWHYLRLIVVPTITQMALFHDDLVISQSLFAPITTALAVVSIIITVAWIIITTRKKTISFTALGLAFYLTAHLMESSIISLELMHEHRNYVPMAGILIAMVASAYQFALRKGSLTSFNTFFLVVILSLSLATFIRASRWESWPVLVLTESQNRPNSSRTQYEAGLWHFNKLLKALNAEEKATHFELARIHLERAYQLTQTDSAALFGLIRLHDKMDLPLEDGWLTAANIRLATAPFGQPAARYFTDLLRCEMRHYCSLGKSVINPFIESALSNPTLKGPSKAFVLADSAILKATWGDGKAAYDYARQATQLYPEEGTFRIYVIELAIAHNDIATAKEQYRLLKQHNPNMVRDVPHLSNYLDGLE